jgi:hypothetical protein
MSMYCMATIHKSGRIENRSKMAAVKVAEIPPAKFDYIEIVPIREIVVG